MQSRPVQSSGRRFLKRLGFALLQAAVFGSLFGGLMYFRVPRTQLEVEGAPQTVMAELAELIEGPERLTYDVRVRALGERLQRQRLKESKAEDRVAWSSPWTTTRWPTRATASTRGWPPIPGPGRSSAA